MERKPLGKILKQLEKHIGEFHTDRINIHINPAQKTAMLDRLAQGLDKIGTTPVQEFITTDGYKFSYPRRMGCLPSQRHRTSGSLLPRDQKCGADENAQERLSEDLEIGTETPKSSA